MAHSVPYPPEDPVLVLVDHRTPVGSFDEWLALVAEDGPTDHDAGAAEILREYRDHGET